MALIRAEIRYRLGDSSIYDGVVEYQSDFQTEPMLAAMHYGSMMLCLNYPDNQNSNDEPAASDLYIKREDGSWKIVVSAGDVTADAVAAAIGEMTPSQAAGSLSALGGEQVFIVRLVESSGTISADKTYAEITAAKEAGMDIVLDVGTCRVPMIQSASEFYAYLFTDDAAIMNVITIGTENTVGTSQHLIMPGVYRVNVSGTTPTINLQNHCVYVCGTLTSLIIDGNFSTGEASIIFVSGATPTTISGIDNFTAEANMRYRIDVQDGYATFDSWPVSA